MYSLEEILVNNDDIEEIQEDNQEVGDLEEVEREENEEEAPEEVKKDVEDEEKPVKKVRKRSNRPLLNLERLKGPRGLICMENTFSKLKFKGKGHEEQDLNTVMHSLHHWCHRLYPKFTFDDTLERIETLGTKKPVVVSLFTIKIHRNHFCNPGLF